MSKSLNFCWIPLLIKNLSPPRSLYASLHPSLDCRPHIGRKYLTYRHILPKIWLVVHIFSFIITTYLKTFSGMKTLSKKQRPAELSLWIITRVYPILPKMFPFLSSYLLPVPRIGCPVLLPNLWRKPCIRERSPPSSQKVLTFETRKIPITK